ncbi:hypothetical protein BJP25_21570 [Actinokineospora bangkokensis]|uniref:HTH marR-type domain-containing protein n=2 Tax=Actinokineospora bangkokensis TaxID=1193682 RepID=A0A1Q9LL37_9PSEU|nr:hypothetical protein BJP25_21570 [Actinokineospora bangkokensis]
MLAARHAVLVPAKGELERSAYLLLSRLAAGGPMTIAALAEAFGLDVSTVHRQVAVVLKAGLVERVLDPGGGVARLLRVTAEGQRKLVAERGRILGCLRDILGEWPAERVAVLADVLIGYNEAVEGSEGRSWPR